MNRTFAGLIAGSWSAKTRASTSHCEMENKKKKKELIHLDWTNKVIMTRLEQEYLHLSSTHKGAVIKIIEMNDSNGVRIFHMDDARVPNPC